MNEQLSELVAQGFGKALSYVQATESFVAEQAPLLIQEVINYGLAYNGFLTVLWLVLGSAAIYTSVRLIKYANTKEAYNDEGPAILGVFFGVFGVGSIIGFLCEVAIVLKIVFAPRLYLLEELGRLT
jgi:hypothetical protein